MTQGISTSLALAIGLLMGGNAYCEDKAGHWVSDISVRPEAASLCDGLSVALSASRLVCALDVLETYPGFKTPPWTYLNPAEHRVLIAKLNATETGFSYLRTHKVITAEEAEPVYRLFIEQRGQIAVWRTHLLTNFGDNGERPAPPGDQTIVQTTFGFPTDDPSRLACPGKSSKNFIRRTYVALPDLSGPDLEIGDGTAGTLRTHMPMLYGTEVVFIGNAFAFAGDEIEEGRTEVLTNDKSTGLNKLLCSFRFVHKAGSR